MSLAAPSNTKQRSALSAVAVFDRAQLIQKLSTVEIARQEAGVSRRDLAAAAHVERSWYFRILREPHRASAGMVGRLEAALRRLQGQASERDFMVLRHGLPSTPSSTAAVLAEYVWFLAAIAPFYEVTPAQVRASRPQRGATADPQWVRCAHARQAALYLTHTALRLNQRKLAAALQVTPAAVCLALQSVEDRRSDPRFDAALDAAQQDVTGGMQ